MSKTDKLWEAIGGIDDSIVEECSGKRPRMTRIPWGTIASAACLCLVIGSLVVMRGLGLLSPATQPTEPTTVPVTSTQPPETTKETAPPIQTVPHNTLPTPELQMYNDLFSDPYGWYNAALRCEYATPEDISLLMLFYGGFEDESRDPTDEEWAQLKDIEGFNENYDLLRLPVRKMDTILTELFGISLADVKPEGFEGLTYLESTDCWYHMTTSIRYADFTARDVKPTLTGTKVYYDGGYKGNMVVTVTPNGASGYRILSNLPISAEEKTAMERISELFNESDSWYNRALMSQFAAPQKLQLREFFFNMEDVPKHELTAEEWAIFGEERVPEAYRMVRLERGMMNELLTRYFGVTVEQMASSAFEGLTYLESTDCWYFVKQGMYGDVVVHVHSLSELPDGRMQVNYTRGDLDGGSPIYSMVLQPDGDGYRILCNFRADDEMQALREEFDALFSGLSRYCFALSNWYDSPEKVWLRGLFETGFQGEHEPTDEEWVQLKNVQGFSENYDFFRLPVSKMNEVLMQYFGITLDQMDASAFDGLTYLESTDCWYYMATGAVGINGFRTQLVEYPPDGTIRVYYISNYKDGVGMVTLQPYGDGYRILSNIAADSGTQEPSTTPETTAAPTTEPVNIYCDLPEFIPATDLATLPANPVLSDLVTTGYTGSACWIDLSDNIMTPIFCLPSVTPFSPDAIAINREIAELYNPTLEQTRGCFEQKTSAIELKISYTATLNGDILSINITTVTDFDYNLHRDFSIDITTGRRLELPGQTEQLTKPIDMDSDLTQEIEKAWLERTGQELVWYTDDQYRGMRYYGHFEGYEVIFYPTESVTDMFASVTIGGYDFWHSDTFEIYAYRDGKFRTLLDAYDSGDISGDSVAAIYEIHKPFEKL